MTVLATFAAVLSVTIWPHGQGGTWTNRVVYCPGQPFCAKIVRAAFAPVPPGVACTEIYGGPELARVTGTIGGRKVSARFKRTDGCEIARWNRLAFLFRA